MKRAPIARLLGLVSGHRRWIAAGALLGFLAIASNVALVAMSAYLVSRAAVVTNVADLALAVTAVRVLAKVPTVSEGVSITVVDAQHGIDSNGTVVSAAYDIKSAYAKLWGAGR